jgi:hypothetical protein
VATSNQSRSGSAGHRGARGTRALNRREALRRLATGAVGAATSTIWVEALSALAREQAHTHAASAVITAQAWTPKVLTTWQNDAVVTLTELIIPETDTPGAKAVRVNRFIDTVLSGTSPANRDQFFRGLTWIDQRSTALYGKDFLAAGTENQTALLTRLSKDGNPDGEDAIGTQFFQAIKSMTISGYYTTEIGLRKELGDDGQLFLVQFQGCNHPEHQ